MIKEMKFKLGILFGLLIIVYFPVFLWMIERWSATDSYYSHGFLIPFISIFIIWHKRKKLENLDVQPSNEGWLLFFGGIFLYLISALCRIYSTASISLLFVLAGLILLFLGKKYLRELQFPLLFLVFMLPLPLFITAHASFRLKLIAAQLAVAAINSLGVSAIREGSIIKTSHAYLIVEDPCSGIRSLISLIALGALMAYFSGKTHSKKIVLFLSSIPIAIIANALRIVVLTLISEMYGPRYITGFFHSLMGIIVFIVSLFGLAVISRLLG
jgi:exosortase